MTITDYSNLRGISDSTIRRYIRKDKILWKKRDGKYLISINEDELIQNKDMTSDQLTIGLIKQENEILKNELRKIQEENNELKMLVRLYETGNDSEKESNTITF